MEQQQPDRKTSEGLRLGLKLVWELGYIIAIPVVVLGFGGAYLDKRLGISPLFLLLGLGLALFLSWLGVRRMIRKIMRI